jgi:hypothetical protein
MIPREATLPRHGRRIGSSLASSRAKEIRVMATEDSKAASDLGAQAIELAEQLGRMAGTIEGTAEAWLDRQRLADQLTRVRDSATKMLESLRAAARKGRASQSKPAKGASTASTRKADPARAPGKRRRKPAPSMRGVKKSNQTIPKMRTAATVRQRRKSYA